MENNKAELFLKHLLLLIKEQMDEISPMSKAENEFQSGRSLGYYEVAGLIVECSKVFDLSLESLNLTNFNPDVLL